MIRNKEREEVRVIGGPYRRFVGDLLSYYETFMVQVVARPKEKRELPLSKLQADGGDDEVRRAAEELLKD